MSYEGINSLNELAPATPLDGASMAELAEAIRQMKSIVKNVMLQSMRPNGGLRPISSASIETDSVGTGQLIDLAVTTAKLALLSVTHEQLAALAVTTGKIADDAVTGPKIAAGAIGADHYADESIPRSALAEALTSAYIQASASDDTLRAITSDHIKDLAVLDRAINTMALTKLIGGTEGQLLIRGAELWSAVTPAGALTYNPTTGLFSITSPTTTAVFGDLKSRGSDGGGSTAGAWVTRDLGEIEDARGLMTFTGNTFKLTPGLYFIHIKCPVAGAVGRHQARLFRDNGDSTNQIPLWGSSEQCAASQSGSSIIQGTLVVDDEEMSFKVEHWCQNAVASNGLGNAASSDNTVAYGNHSELYTTGYVIRLAVDE
jgi:hypothetical protein